MGEIMKKRLVLMSIILLYATSLYAASGDLLVYGKLGAGTATPAYPLDAFSIESDPASFAYTAYIHQRYACTAARAADYVSTLQIERGRFAVPEGVTTSGRQTGLTVFTSITDPEFYGTISDLRGIYAKVGIASAASSGARTVTNAYGVFIENPVSAGVVTNNWGLYQATAGAKNYLAGKVGIGTTNLGTGGASALLFANGTRPENLTGVAGLYATTGTRGTVLTAFDSNGNDTPISPHAIDAPDWMYDPEDGIPLMVKEAQRYLGYVRYTNQTRQARLASMTDAEKSALTPKQRTCVFKESFADHNARLGLTGDKALVQLDWDTEQQAIKDARDAERLAALNAQTSQQAAKTMAVAKGGSAGGEGFAQETPVQVPEEYIIQPMPAQLRAAMDASRR